MGATRNALAGAAVAIALLGASAVTGQVAGAGDATPSTTLVPGSSAPTVTVAPEEEAASFAFVDGTELSCDPAITEAVDTFRVTKAAWATDLIVVPQVQVNGIELVFEPAELGPGVTSATAVVTYPTPGGHWGRGATGSLVVLNPDRTPASGGAIPVAFVGAINCPPSTSTSTSTTTPAPSVPVEPAAPAAASVTATADYTG